MEPLLIDPINMTKCPKQAHLSQHKHGLVDLTNLDSIVGGCAPKLRRIKSMIKIRGDNLGQDHRSQLVVAALVPHAHKMAKISHHFN